MSIYAESAKRVSNLTRTENNAVALKSTNSALVDLFATFGSLRGKDYSEISKLFRMALAEDKLLAVKTMFYGRNIRGGLQERETFRKMLLSLASTDPDIVIKNIPIIALYGRYDDLYVLIGTKAENAMWDYLEDEIASDLRALKLGGSVSLCAKWLKSINTSSEESKKLGRATAKAFKLTQKEYRQTLAILRKHLKVVEGRMSAKDWKNIDYGKVTSGAMKNYRKAFQAHDPEGFEKFMEKVESGEETINSSTLFPYDILMAGNLTCTNWWNDGCLTMDEDKVLESQWKALPNYVTGENNILVMADTSGSMDGRPMATAIGLAIYFAERNKGAYKDLLMTFSKTPAFVTLKGTTLKDKVECIHPIVQNTDLEKAFNLILEVAVDKHVSQEELPKTLVIISDMHFDMAVAGDKNEVFFDTIKRKYESAGYEMPTVVFWNVSNRQAHTFQVTVDSRNVILVSGNSTSTFKSLLSNVGRTPYEYMLETLKDPMYDFVTI